MQSAGLLTLRIWKRQSVECKRSDCPLWCSCRLQSRPSHEERLLSAQCPHQICRPPQAVPNAHLGALRTVPNRPSLFPFSSHRQCSLRIHPRYSSSRHTKLRMLRKSSPHRSDAATQRVTEQNSVVRRHTVTEAGFGGKMADKVRAWAALKEHGVADHAGLTAYPGLSHCVAGGGPAGEACGRR